MPLYQEVIQNYFWFNSGANLQIIFPKFANVQLKIGGDVFFLREEIFFQ